MALSECCRPVWTTLSLPHLCLQSWPPLSPAPTLPTSLCCSPQTLPFSQARSLPRRVPPPHPLLAPPGPPPAVFLPPGSPPDHSPHCPSTLSYSEPREEATPPGLSFKVAVSTPSPSPLLGPEWAGPAPPPSSRLVHPAPPHPQPGVFSLGLSHPPVSRPALRPYGFCPRHRK